MANDQSSDSQRVPHKIDALSRGEQGREESSGGVMTEGDIPDFGIFLSNCHYPPAKHVEVARAAKAAFPDIFQWMKENPDGVSEDMPGGREKFTRLNSFIANCLPQSQSKDFRAVGHLLFMAAAYTPEMIENERKWIEAQRIAPNK